MPASISQDNIVELKQEEGLLKQTVTGQKINLSCLLKYLAHSKVRINRLFHKYSQTKKSYIFKVTQKKSKFALVLLNVRYRADILARRAC